MRNLVISLSDYARSRDPDFIVIPQNGQELITQNGESTGTLQRAYLNAVDGTGREDLFYGYDRDNTATRHQNGITCLSSVSPGEMQGR